MPTTLKFSGYLTVVCAVITALYVLNIEYLEYKGIYAISIVVASFPIGLGAVLIAKIYEKLTEGESGGGVLSDMNYIRERNKQRRKFF
ncbi:hypothetical protein WAK64_00880 [Bacillus spongiae]|uniref:Uncharacterized protein n=1 Tax=Bacillus spongiae TaxID=2683610 RepID=A0ABU8H8I2_9BACI